MTWKRLYGPALLTDVAATVYTVPASSRTRVRFIHVSNPTEKVIRFRLSIGTDAVALRIFDWFTMTPNSVLPHFCEHVLEATEFLQAYAELPSFLVLVINGEQDLVP